MIVVTGNNGDLPLATQRRVESIASGDRPSPSLDRIYQLGLWLAIFFAIFLRLPPNKFLRIPPDLSPVSIRLALLFLLLRAPSWPGPAPVLRWTHARPRRRRVSPPRDRCHAHPSKRARPLAAERRPQARPAQAAAHPAGPMASASAQRGRDLPADRPPDQSRGLRSCSRRGVAIAAELCWTISGRTFARPT